MQLTTNGCCQISRFELGLIPKTIQRGLTYGSIPWRSFPFMSYARMIHIDTSQLKRPPPRPKPLTGHGILSDKKTPQHDLEKNERSEKNDSPYFEKIVPLSRSKVQPSNSSRLVHPGGTIAPEESAAGQGSDVFMETYEKTARLVKLNKDWRRRPSLAAVADPHARHIQERGRQLQNVGDRTSLQRDIDVDRIASENVIENTEGQLRHESVMGTKVLAPTPTSSQKISKKLLKKPIPRAKEVSGLPSVAYPWAIREEWTAHGALGNGGGYTASNSYPSQRGTRLDGLTSRHDNPADEDKVEEDDQPERLSWFPGHMAKAVREMRERMANVQVVVEVRDARIPFASANPLLESIIITKPRVVVFNKVDLAGDVYSSIPAILDAFNRALPPISSPSPTTSPFPTTSSTSSPIPQLDNRPFNYTPEQIRETITTCHSFSTSSSSSPPSSNIPVFVSRDNRTAFMFCDAKSPTTVRVLLSTLKRITPTPKFKAVSTSVLICGYPNVGKSTLINSLRSAARKAGALEDGYSLDHTLSSSTPSASPSFSTGSIQSRSSTSTSPLAPVTAYYISPSQQGGVAHSITSGMLSPDPGVMARSLDRGLDNLYISRESKAKAKVGADPGVTRRIDGFKVSNDPPIVILDTPGVMVPRLSSLTASLRLSITGSITSKVTDTPTMAAYLLHVLNRSGEYRYVSLFKLPFGRPTSNLRHVLYHLALSQGWSDPLLNKWRKELEYSPQTIRASDRAVKVDGEEIHVKDMSPELEVRAMTEFVKMYREGKLGKFVVDRLG